MSYDLINGLFEAGGGLLICLSILRLHKDKMVRGISPAPTVFFACWGVWNLLYYPSLDQWYSFLGGCVIVTANTIWIAQMFYYIRREKRGFKPVGTLSVPISPKLHEAMGNLRKSLDGSIETEHFRYDAATRTLAEKPPTTDRWRDQ